MIEKASEAVFFYKDKNMLANLPVNNIIRWIGEIWERRVQGAKQGYKTLIILAVLEILENDSEHINRFEYTELLPIFKQLFSPESKIRESQFSNPYIRLGNDKITLQNSIFPTQIWIPHPIEGASEDVNPANYAAVRRNYPYATINEAVWEAFLDGKCRERIKQEIYEKFDPSIVQPEFELFNTANQSTNNIATSLDDHKVQVIENLISKTSISTDEERRTKARKYLSRIYSLEECSSKTFLSQAQLEHWTRIINFKKQAIFYGPPGTGKTFIAENLAKHLIGGKDSFYEIIQFHPSYTYEDFIQGIRPQTGSKNELVYSTVKGRFLDFCEEASQCKDDCILIIDEINRANLSQVFGELMYLLEYREETISLAGGESFQIPDNVRIIGTMNTADRSISLVDYALRRRFAFICLRPDYSLLIEFHKGKEPDVFIEKLVKKLQEINEVISDSDYELGVSFFLKDNLRLNLDVVWQAEIEPYLEEYFFRDKSNLEKFRWNKVKNFLL